MFDFHADDVDTVDEDQDGYVAGGDDRDDGEPENINNNNKLPEILLEKVNRCCKGGAQMKKQTLNKCQETRAASSHKNRANTHSHSPTFTMATTSNLETLNNSNNKHLHSSKNRQEKLEHQLCTLVRYSKAKSPQKKTMERKKGAKSTVTSKQKRTFHWKVG